MARNARDTPKGYNRHSHWLHPPDSLTTVPPQLVYSCYIHGSFTAISSVCLPQKRPSPDYHDRIDAAYNTIFSHEPSIAFA